jgi:hypothetical protein
MGRGMVGHNIRMTGKTGDIGTGDTRRNYSIISRITVADSTIIKTMGRMFGNNLGCVTTITISIGQNRMIMSCTMVNHAMTGTTIDWGSGNPVSNCLDYDRFSTLVAGIAIQTMVIDMFNYDILGVARFTGLGINQRHIMNIGMINNPVASLTIDCGAGGSRTGGNSSDYQGIAAGMTGGAGIAMLYDMLNIDIGTVTIATVTGGNDGIIVVSGMAGKRNMATFASKRGTGNNGGNNIRITAAMTTAAGKSMIVDMFNREIGTVTC